jgi:hypothetical protein
MRTVAEARRRRRRGIRTVAVPDLRRRRRLVVARRARLRPRRRRRGATAAALRRRRRRVRGRLARAATCAPTPTPWSSGGGLAATPTTNGTLAARSALPTLGHDWCAPAGSTAPLVTCLALAATLFHDPPASQCCAVVVVVEPAPCLAGRVPGPVLTDASRPCRSTRPLTTHGALVDRGFRVRLPATALRPVPRQPGWHPPFACTLWIAGQAHPRSAAHPHPAALPVHEEDGHLDHCAERTLGYVNPPCSAFLPLACQEPVITCDFALQWGQL